MAKFKKLPYSSDWELNNSILIEAVDIILNDFKIDYKHDVPYVAGYSVNGDTIYIDKDVYAALKKENKEKWLKPLSFHEAIEKSLMMQHPELMYQFCHQNALRLELDLVKAMKIDKKAYDAFMDKEIERLAKIKKFNSLPKDLDLKPYADESSELLNTLKKEMKENSFLFLRGLLNEKMQDQ